MANGPAILSVGISTLNCGAVFLNYTFRTSGAHLNTNISDRDILQYIFIILWAVKHAHYNNLFFSISSIR